jgi:hypothetical protein
MLKLHSCLVFKVQSASRTPGYAGFTYQHSHLSPSGNYNCCFHILWPSVLQESDIMRKLDMRRISTVDMNQNVINIGDYVTLEGTQAAQRPGTAPKGPQGGVCACAASVQCALLAVY